MLFNCILKTTPTEVSNLLISANTLTNCASYLEGTGKDFSSMNFQNQQFIAINTLSDESYNVSLKDNTTSVILSYIIYDTYVNVISWINLQSGKSLQNIQYQKRPFVQI